MDTPAQDYDGMMEQLAARRRALAAQLYQIEQTRSADTRHDMKGPWQAEADRQYRSAVNSVRAQLSDLQQQEQLLGAQQRRMDSQERRAEIEKGRAQRAQIAARKDEAAQAKEQVAQLEKNSAAAFGLGPKRGVGNLLAQGAVYDPRIGRVVVPLDEKAKLSVAETSAAKRNADQVSKTLNSVAKAQGFQGPVAPQSVFGMDKPEVGEDGDLSFKIGKQTFTIPEETYDKLSEKYADSIPDVAQPVRTMDPGIFNQANQQYNLLNGIKSPTIVDASKEREALAARAMPSLLASQNQNVGSIPLPGHTFIQRGPAPGMEIVPQLTTSGPQGFTIPAETIVPQGPTISGLPMPNDNFYGASIVPETRMAPFRPGYKTQIERGKESVKEQAKARGITEETILANQNAALEMGYAIGSPEEQRLQNSSARSASLDRIPGIIGRGIVDYGEMFLNPEKLVYSINANADRLARPVLQKALDPYTEQYQSQLDLLNLAREKQGLPQIEKPSTDPFSWGP